MQLRSHRRKINIVGLDKEGLLSLQAEDFAEVCKLCGARDENAEAVLSSIGFDETADVEGLWNTVWVAVQRETGRIVGAIRMLGNPGEGRELAISLHPAATYEDKDFARVFEIVCEWIFSHRAVYYIRVDAKDEDQVAFLRHYGFARNEYDGLYEREKNRPVWGLFCLCLGLGTGVAISDVIGDLSLGVAIGGLLGVVVGVILDRIDVTRRRPK